MPRASLPCSLLPTPFHRLHAVSHLLGAEIWCKRDDLTGFGFGGNKTRKLDILLAEALAAHATDIVAVGGVQSNFCRMAAAYASAQGLPCTLVLGAGSERASGGGNLALDELFAASILRVESDDWDAWEERARILEQRMREAGRRPFHLPIGGSTPSGALGYARAMSEVLEDAARCGIEIGTIVHATSSGGTQAGLLAGKTRAGWDGRIIGISVTDPSMHLHGRIAALAQAAGERLGVAIDERDVMVDERWAGEGYAVPSASGEDAQRLFARLEGIVLDGVYTAKAAAGLLAMVRMGELDTRKAIVFLHTGGSPAFFSHH